MKTGDRVRILRGEHEGRLGTITDVAARRAAVDKILKPSPTRDHLLSKLAVPTGYHAVQLDPGRSAPTGGDTSGTIEVFSENLLMKISGPLGGAPMPLEDLLVQIEAKARNAAGERAVPWRISDEYGSDVATADGLHVATGYHFPIALLLAVQPQVTLALVAKLREAVRLANDLAITVTKFRSHGDGYDRLQLELEKRIDALSEIEAP